VDGTQVLTFLQHHGVKGQKWGIRNARPKGFLGSIGKHNRGARADKKWQKNIYTFKSVIAIHNNVAHRMNNGGLASLNAQPRWKGIKVIDDKGNIRHGDPQVDSYLKAYEKLNEDYTKRAVKEIHGTSPSGSYKAVLDTSNQDQWRVKVVHTNVQHADLGPLDLDMEVDHDAKGMIIGVHEIQTTATHSDIFVEEFLEHHGVKGMKWGIRHKPPSIKRSGDSRRVSDLRKRKAHQLTNKQLKTINDRMNLEQNFNRLNPGKFTNGKRLVESILATATLGATAFNLINSPAGKAAVSAGKKALNAK
jgi:hypothetical protein